MTLCSPRVALLALLLIAVPAFAPRVRADDEDAAPSKPKGPQPEWVKELYKKLPEDVRAKALELIEWDPEDQPELAKLGDDQLNAAVMGQLAQHVEAADFVLVKVEKDPSRRVRRAIVGRFPWSSYGKVHPEVFQLLERIASTDAERDVFLPAIEALRAARMRAIKDIVTARLEGAKDKGDVNALLAEQERWISLANGTMLPGFMREPQSLPALKPADQPLRVLAFGDWGTGSDGQKWVAAAAGRFHAKTPFDFAVALGDNFYPRGPETPRSVRWRSQFEDLYGPMKLKFMAVFGNHDWFHPDSPAAEILYSGASPSWVLPSPYYTYSAGPVQFFALDTNEMSKAQLLWLDAEIGKSTARWKIAYGHHQIYSATRGDNKTLIADLLPLLKGRVDVYLCGHDHNLQHCKPDGGVNFFVAGGGGAPLYPFQQKDYERSLFKSSAYGFCVLDVGKDEMKVSFVGTEDQKVKAKEGDEKTLYEVTLKK